MYELFCTAQPVYRYQIMLLDIKLLNPKHCGKTCLHQQFKEKFDGHNLRMFTADLANTYKVMARQNLDYCSPALVKYIIYLKDISIANFGP